MTPITVNTLSIVVLESRVKGVINLCDPEIISMTMTKTTQQHHVLPPLPIPIADQYTQI